MKRSLLLCVTCLLIGCNGGKSKSKSGSENADAKSGSKDPYSKAMDAGRQVEVKKNLSQIVTAMHNYAETHRTMPAAGSGGKGLSWRVHLLPFLGQSALYNQFKKNEPWDSAHNRTLIEKMPAIFNSPGSANHGKTSYQVFVGKGTPFGGDKPPGFRDIIDGTSNTIMVVFAGNPVEWTKPGGIEFNAADPAGAFGGMPESGLIVALFDTSVRTLPANFDARILALLIQHADRQLIPQ
jgi:hypothetical protein